MQVSCKGCGKLFLVPHAWHKRGAGKNCSYACREKNRNVKAERHPNWKGGKWAKCDGYVAVTRIGSGSKHDLEHKIVMEKHLKRKLTKSEVVHHINHVKSDNRIENLMVMTRSEHSRLHAKEKAERMRKGNSASTGH